jgi:hypothetical protein
MQGIAVPTLFFFSFFYLHKTPNTRLFRSINISLFPAFDARRPAWHSTWRSLHIPIDTCSTFCGMLCYYFGIILGCEQDCLVSRAPPSPPTITSQTHTQPGFAPENTTVRLSDGLLSFLLPAENHAFWSHVFKANYPIRPLHLGFSKQQQPPPPPPPPLSGHRNSFRGKKHSIQCIGSFALQLTTIN